MQSNENLVGNKQLLKNFRRNEFPAPIWSLDTDQFFESLDVKLAAIGVRWITKSFFIITQKETKNACSQTWLMKEF
jgi:hypothetical protein